MSKIIRWEKGGLIVEPPKRPKKITGTRFASIFGLNKWNTPFQAWCEITRTYERPFEDTIYTIAGKVIEPKQAQFMKDSYYMSNLVTPTDMFGEDYFKKTHGDFFHFSDIFGGMWDYLLSDGGVPKAVLEMKTTKRVEDWRDDVPEYYALQASLYAYLLNVDDVYMVATFLEDDDYKNPEAFECTYENTMVKHFKVSERYPDFEDRIKSAKMFWDKHVMTGISPKFDEKADKEFLDALRQIPCANTDLEVLCKKAEELQKQLDSMKPIEAELKNVKNLIKESLEKELTNGNTRCNITIGGNTWTLTKSLTNKVDTKKLEEDGLFDKYVTTSETLKLTVKENEL